MKFITECIVSGNSRITKTKCIYVCYITCKRLKFIFLTYITFSDIFCSYHIFSH